MFPNDVYLVLSSLEVKNSEALVIEVREMASVKLIPVGAAFVPGKMCVCM